MRLVFGMLVAFILGQGISSASARACGQGREMAAAYLHADKIFENEDQRFRCKVLMLGHMLCVGRRELLRSGNKEYVLAALADAWKSSDKRLRCAAAEVHGGYLGFKSASSLSRPQKTSQREWESLTQRFGTMCKDVPLGTAPDYADLPLNPPGKKLLSCLSQ